MHPQFLQIELIMFFFLGKTISRDHRERLTLPPYWILLKIIGAAAFRIIGLAKNIIPLDWIYHSIRMKTVVQKVIYDIPYVHLGEKSQFGSFRTDEN